MMRARKLCNTCVCLPSDRFVLVVVGQQQVNNLGTYPIPWEKAQENSELRSAQHYDQEAAARLWARIQGGSTPVCG